MGRKLTENALHLMLTILSSIFFKGPATPVNVEKSPVDATNPSKLTIKA